MAAVRVWHIILLENNMNMKLATVFALALLGYSVSSAAADKDLIRCDSCTVITCDDETCTVYECSDGTCTEIGAYPNPDGGDGGSGSSSLGVTSENADGERLTSAKGDGIRPLYGPRGGLDCGQQRCLIKSCNEMQCTLIGFESGQSISLGSFDNNDAVMDRIAEDFRNADETFEKEH